MVKYAKLIFGYPQLLLSLSQQAARLYLMIRFPSLYRIALLLRLITFRSYFNKKKKKHEKLALRKHCRERLSIRTSSTSGLSG